MSNVLEKSVQALRAARRPRLGFLGVGWIGRHRLQTIAERGLAEIVAVADTQPEMAAEAQRLSPDAVAASSLDEMLALGLDGVLIATPNLLHATQSIAALQSDVAVFCQKPLARNAGEAMSVVDAARKADRLLGVDFSYRYIPAMSRVRELIRSGELGNLYAVNLVFHNAYGPDKSWFYNRQLSGGGCLLDLGVHLVDLALWSLDWPSVDSAQGQVYSGGNKLGPNDQRVEDFAFATLNLDSGTTVHLACSWKLPVGCDAVIEASFYGTHGGAVLRNIGGSFLDFEAFRMHGTRRDVLGTPDEPWFGLAAVNWVERLAHDARFDPEADHLVTVSQVLDDLYGQGAAR